MRHSLQKMIMYGDINIFFKYFFSSLKKKKFRVKKNSHISV